MDFYSIGLAAASAVAAAIIASLIFGRKPEKKTAYTVVIVILFLGFNALSKEYILPKLNAKKVMADIQTAFNEVPAFVSIKKYEPEIYQTIIASVAVATRDGASQQQMIDMMRQQISTLVESRMPHASDSALLGYVDVMVAEMEVLNKQGAGLCYKFLFPAIAGGINPRTSFSAEMQKRDLAALDEIIKTSNTKQAIPEQSTVLPFLQPVIASLNEKYGDDVSILDNPAAPNVDKDKVCQISIDLYRGVLALPPEQSAPVLRWMFGQL